MGTTEAAIGHVDADCFYVSAERVRNRFLEDKPVAVLGNQGACVIAKSYEMKGLGVKTGEPIWEARPKCPDGIYLKRDFRWYELLSRAMLAVVEEFSPRIEYYSIDECFFEAVPLRGRTLQETAVALRDRIKEIIGVPVTVGIARTRTLAKLISDTAKPFGALAVLGGEAEASLLATRSVTDVTGIAGRRERRLKAWNIRTCLDLASADRKLVRALLTTSGEALWWELRGEPARPLHPERPLHKTLSRGGSFGMSTARPLILYAWLVRNLERLIEELHYHGVCAGRLTVWIAYRDGKTCVGSMAPTIPTDRFDLLLDTARPALRRAWRPGVEATRMELIADRLVTRCSAPLGLFDRPDDRIEAISRLKREVNERLGRFALRSGATLPLHAIYRDTTNGFDICDIRGKMCF